MLGCLRHFDGKHVAAIGSFLSKAFCSRIKVAKHSKRLKANWEKGLGIRNRKPEVN